MQLVVVVEHVQLDVRARRDHASTMAGSTAASRRPWNTCTGIVSCAFNAVVVAARRYRARSGEERCGRNRSGRRRGHPMPSTRSRPPSPRAGMDSCRQSSAGASSTSRATSLGRCNAACTATNPPRLEPMSATGSPAASIASTICATMRVMVSVEKSGWFRSGASNGTAERGEFRGKERGLRRLCRRGKAVKVEDPHQSMALHPGRQRHGIDWAPSVR